jgi:hypothetical protein
MRARAGDCGEEFIVYIVELGRAESGGDVLDDADCAGVLGVETKELYEVSTNFPFWLFVSILKTWVKDVGLTAKDFGALEVFAIHLG